MVPEAARATASSLRVTLSAPTGRPATRIGAAVRTALAPGSLLWRPPCVVAPAGAGAISGLAPQPASVGGDAASSDARASANTRGGGGSTPRRLDAGGDNGSRTMMTLA